MKTHLLLICLFLSLVHSLAAAADDSVHVLVWDEQQPKQTVAYKNFLGNAIAGHLKQQPGLEVRSVKLDDPEQGLSEENLNWADVLIWWGHVRQGEIKPDMVRSRIVKRVTDGTLSLIALHSAHWSTPFMECMNEKTRQETKRRYPSPKARFDFVPPPGRMAPDHDSIVTPAWYALKRGGAARVIRVDLPNCCFPDYRPDGEPSRIQVLKPNHPLAKGLPPTFKIPRTEMYNEPFHVPEPDEVVFYETWEKGEKFRSGSVWKIGKGRVFYFRPGHETFGVFLEPEPLKVVENAARWLGAKRAVE